MIIKQAEYITSGTEIKHLPDARYNEYAFIGRSNVGKSSLINALIGKRISIVSATKGRTKQLNFFKILFTSLNIFSTPLFYEEIKNIEKESNELIELCYKLKSKIPTVVITNVGGYQSNDISVVFIALFFIPLIVGGMSFMYDMVVHQNMDEAYKNAKSIKNEH